MSRIALDCFRREGPGLGTAAAAQVVVHGDEARELSVHHYFWTDQWGMDIKLSGPLPNDSEAPEIGKGTAGAALLPRPLDRPRRGGLLQHPDADPPQPGRRVLLRAGAGRRPTPR